MKRSEDGRASPLRHGRPFEPAIQAVPDLEMDGRVKPGHDDQSYFLRN
jgi:hypothetical protein